MNLRLPGSRTARFTALDHDTLFSLVQAVNKSKSKPGSQLPSIPWKADEALQKVVVNVNSTREPVLNTMYRITHDWTVFFNAYRKFFPVHDDILNYGGQFVKVVLIENSIVKVLFATTQQYGWLPTEVLRDVHTKDYLLPFEGKKTKTWKEPPPETDKEALVVELEDLNSDLKKSNSLFQEDLKKKQYEIHSLRVQLDNSYAEKQTHLTRHQKQVRELQIYNATLKAAVEDLDYEMERMVPKSLSSLELIIENCTINDLTQAKSLFDRRIEQLHTALQRQLDGMKESQRCSICLSSPRTILFQPCGHFCTCTDCCGQLQARAVMENEQLKCPICREPVNSTSPVYSV